MEVAFHKENYYALIMCMLAPEELSVDKACDRMKIPMGREKVEYKITPGVYKKQYNKKISSSSIPEIADLYYKKNMNLREIADVYEVTPACIGYNLKQNGYKLRKVNGPVKKTINITKKQYLDLKKKGKNDNKIALMTGCCLAVLRRYKKEWGLIHEKGKQ